MDNAPQRACAARRLIALSHIPTFPQISITHESGYGQGTATISRPATSFLRPRALRIVEAGHEDYAQAEARRLQASESLDARAGAGRRSALSMRQDRWPRSLRMAVFRCDARTLRAESFGTLTESSPPGRPGALGVIEVSDAQPSQAIEAEKDSLPPFVPSPFDGECVDNITTTS